MKLILTVLSFVALLSIALSAKLPTSNKQTIDSCSSDSDCPSDATCLDTLAILQGDISAKCGPSSDVCMCHGPASSCVNSFGCPAGRRCVQLGAAEFSEPQYFCLPCAADCDTIRTVVSNREMAVQKMNTNGRQLTALCLDNNPPNCANPDPTRPGPPVIASVTADTEPSLVFVVPPRSTETVMEASPSTLPSFTPNVDFMTPMTSSSAYASPTVSEPNASGEVETEEEEAVCIDAKALSGFAMSDLVYEDGHKRAAVLCDNDENCATPGHIVVHQGTAVMMKTYCERVGCTKRVMEVNSPKMKYGLRVQSKSEHLQYTTLSARFETKMEERMLAVVARVYA